MFLHLSICIVFISIILSVLFCVIRIIVSLSSIAVIATQLSTIASFALQHSRKIELVNALVEAYSVLVYCPLSSQCVSGIVLPGLRHLETLVNQCLPQQKDAVRSLLREAESKQDLSKPIERYCTIHKNNYVSYIKYLNHCNKLNHKIIMKNIL